MRLTELGAPGPLGESSTLLVIDKPAGLVCHPTKTDEYSSLISRVRLYLGHDGGRLINRLDRETSGLVLVATTAATARDLGRALAQRDVHKTYRALVHGHLPAEPFTIEAPLGRDVDSLVAIKDHVRPDGAPASTTVRCLETMTIAGVACSHVDVVPHTGRKHQIRVHLAHVGHPVVGDKIYGGDPGRYLRFITGALTAEDRRALVVEFQALHAWRLSFEWNGEAYAVEAPAPAVEADGRVFGRARLA